MKKIFFILFIFSSIYGNGQSVLGYWYGYANVKTKGTANNYLVELILQPEKGFVKGVLNYYFKDTYRSLQVKGNYNGSNRLLSMYEIPLTYHNSIAGFEVDCIMNMQATLRVAQTGSTLQGSFISLPDYKNICTDVNIYLNHNADASKTDSVLNAIKQFKETYQVWKPEISDSLVAVEITPRKVINYVTEKEFKERENVVLNEIEVDTDTLQVSIYDNGEIDGDMVSVFYNKRLILNNQKLTHKSIKINLVLDPQNASNELSLFAENLGLISPNTALVVIQDGKKRIELGLSSSLEKNATIRFKRKKK